MLDATRDFIIDNDTLYRPFMQECIDFPFFKTGYLNRLFPGPLQILKFC